MTVPDFMPMLAKGAHESPEMGACLMEYVSFIAGEEFSDRPMCVDHELCAWARQVNDMCDDEQRNLLVPLISRLMGTNIVPAKENRSFWNSVGTEMGLTSMGYFDFFYALDAFLITRERDGLVARFTKILDAFEKVSGHTPKPLQDKDIELMKELAGMKK